MKIYRLGLFLVIPAFFIETTTLFSQDAISETKELKSHSFLIKGTKSLIELKRKIGSKGMLVVLKINRIDEKHIKAGNSIIVPDTFDNILDFSPFPFYIEELVEVEKLLLVSIQNQAFAAYEFGKQVWWGPVSTGKKDTPTPTGLYWTNWKSKKKKSTSNPEWILNFYFNIENKRGISFHQFALPGYPASHSCIRMLSEDAQWLYNWAEEWSLSKNGWSILSYGTPVIIFGEYSYEEGTRSVGFPLETDTTTIKSEIKEWFGLKPILEKVMGTDTIYPVFYFNTKPGIKSLELEISKDSSFGSLTYSAHLPSMTGSYTLTETILPPGKWYSRIKGITPKFPPVYSNIVMFEIVPNRNDE
ncbi:MAG: L,D-transpeptidase [bacterium]